MTNVFGPSRAPVFGQGTVYRGKLYLPYLKTNPYTAAAVLVSTVGSGVFTSVDLTPYNPQGYEIRDDRGSSVTLSSFKKVIGDVLYKFWTEGMMAPQRIRFCMSTDGSLPAPVGTFFDFNLNMPKALQASLDPAGGNNFHQFMWSLSINQVFGSRIGIVCNLETPGDWNEDIEVTHFANAWFLPLVQIAGPIGELEANYGFVG